MTGLPVVERFFIPRVVMAVAPETSALETGWRRDQVLVTALTLCGTICMAIVAAAGLLVAYINRADPSTLKQSCSRRSAVMALPPGEAGCEQGAERKRGAGERQQAAAAADSADAGGSTLQPCDVGDRDGQVQQDADSAGGGGALTS